MTPRAPSPGTEIDEPRRPSSQVMGRDHFLLVFGPVGALKSPRAFWPQLPWYASHAYGPSGPSGSRTRRACVCTRRDGLVVSSHPKPSLALRPSHRWDEK